MSFGSTKRAELRRSAELFKEIVERDEDGYYFGLAFISDSGYNNEEIQEICKILLERKRLLNYQTKRLT